MQNFILLCHWNGRFGNRMHQYAYGATYQKLLGHEFLLPDDWEGTALFKKQYHKVVDDDMLRLKINQTQAELNTLEYRSSAVKEYAPNARLVCPDSPLECYVDFKVPVFFDSVCAYNQCIFDKMSKSFLKEVFEFNDYIKNTDMYKRAEDIQGTYDIAHLRRDDISSPEYNKVNPQGYSVISKEAYTMAFKKFGFDPKNVRWVSDDFSKKWHTDRKDEARRGSWAYPRGCEVLPDIVFDWMPDFLKLYFARNIFRANSSFSWWAAFLSPTATVYSPVLHKQVIYGRDALEEINVEFVKGNHPHWMYGLKDIIINE